MQYVIISIKHGTGKKPCFWRSNDAGYTTSPFAAGLYSEEQVKSDQAYYNNGESTIAVPFTDEAMYEIGFKCSFDVDKAMKLAKK